jgi:hypothetical protein
MNRSIDKHIITWTACRKAVMKLNNDKSPGVNGITPNSLKALNEKNRRKNYEYACQFCSVEHDMEMAYGTRETVAKKE